VFYINRIYITSVGIEIVKVI